MAVDPVRAKSLFLNASDLADPAERAVFLDRECGGDAELRARVEALLRANDASPLPSPSQLDATVDSELGMPKHGATGDYTPEPDGKSSDPITNDYRPLFEPGLVIAGRYALVQKIGEGGMGEVWVAKQTEPVKRKVAVKLIKTGMDSKAVLTRFEQERQALGMMDHPNIARVLDGGMTPKGQPFFVMELVNGLPLNKFCDEAKLTPRERLELFVPICQAVQHAHQKGIIHRDLKPANILVTLIDAKPVPKIIDFGVAKATSGKLTDESLSTQFGAVVGTLEYMSPEQAGFSGEDIDTRADIYSLGVILYELLTGLRPIDAKKLKKAALTEMVRIIREEEPSKPSTRLSTDESLPSLAALRQTEPHRLMALLRGELDWVVMKCLEKQRERRYETANGLARDVQRYLADEVVEARPPSAAYRLKKFARRHKGQVIAASLVLLALLVGMAGTTWGLIEARNQEQEAKAQEQKAKAQEKEALKQAQLARDETAEKEKALLAEARRAEGERLAKLDAKAKQAEAELQKTRAEAGEKLAKERLVQVEAAQRKADEANQVAQKARHFFQYTLLGPQNLRKEANEEQFQPGGLPAQATENPTIRELLVRAAKELAPNKIESHFPKQPLLQAEFLTTMGSTYRDVGEHELAIGFLERAAALFKQQDGADANTTTNAMNTLALAYSRVGKNHEAIALWEHCYAARLKVYGANDRGTLTMQNNLAMGYVYVGKFKEGIALLEKGYKAEVKNFGAEQPQTLVSLSNLASVYRKAGRFPEAVASLEKLRDSRVKILGAEHPATLATRQFLAGAYLDAGRPELAVSLMKESLARSRKALPKESPQLAGELAIVGRVLLQSKAFAEAEPLIRECLAIREKAQPDAWSTFNAKAMLGSALLGQKKYVDAEPLLLAGYEGMKAREKAIPPQGKLRIPETIERLVQLYEATGKKDEAAKWQKTLETQAGKLTGSVREVGPGLELHGQLSEIIPTLVYEVKLAAGKTYVIDMVSPDQKALDPFLVLTDAAGKKLAEDDDSGGGLNARIVFRAEASAVFRIRATTFNGGAGAFILTVREQQNPPMDKQK